MKKNWYMVLSNQIKHLIEKRRVFVCLYNDSILDDEKSYFKSKIDLVDEKIACYVEIWHLLLKKQ